MALWNNHSAFSIADYVGVAKEEALREYCRHEPLYRYFPRVTLRAGEDGRCPFASEGGCALRGVRPRACQLFPLEATRISLYSSPCFQPKQYSMDFIRFT